MGAIVEVLADAQESSPDLSERMGGIYCPDVGM